MAREESDREDLLREATALVNRAELQLPGQPDTSFVGFRRDGCFSYYLQPERVFHFNTKSELRRAHIDEALVKAEKGRLVRMTRSRTEKGTQLVSRQLPDEEQQQLVAEIETALFELQDGLKSNCATVLGRVAESNDADPIRLVLEWLENRPESLQVALSPHAR